MNSIKFAQILKLPHYPSVVEPFTYYSKSTSKYSLLPFYFYYYQTPTLYHH